VGDRIVIKAIPQKNFVWALMEDGCDQRNVLEVIGTFDGDGKGSIELKSDESSRKVSTTNFFNKKFQMKVCFREKSF
jgi:hypothetical protein